MVGTPLWFDDGKGQYKNPNLTSEEWDAAYAKMLDDLKVKTISQRQCRLYLLSINLLDDVDAAITGMSRAAQIEWEFGSYVARDNPLVIGLQQAFFWTDAQMDEMFTEAAKL